MSVKSGLVYGNVLLVVKFLWVDVGFVCCYVVVCCCVGGVFGVVV